MMCLCVLDTNVVESISKSTLQLGLRLPVRVFLTYSRAWPNCRVSTPNSGLGIAKTFGCRKNNIGRRSTMSMPPDRIPVEIVWRQRSRQAGTNKVWVVSDILTSTDVTLALCVVTDFELGAHGA